MFTAECLVGQMLLRSSYSIPPSTTLNCHLVCVVIFHSLAWSWFTFHICMESSGPSSSTKAPKHQSTNTALKLRLGKRMRRSSSEETIKTTNLFYCTKKTEMKQRIATCGRIAHRTGAAPASSSITE